MLAQNDDLHLLAEAGFGSFDAPLLVRVFVRFELRDVILFPFFLFLLPNVFRFPLLFFFFFPRVQSFQVGNLQRLV